MSDTIVRQIKDLKEKRDAIILVHNYQSKEIQDIADYLGDSLELSQIANVTKSSVIIFCGVHFMAETAAIISPNKTIILPDMNAGCPMAEMVTADKLRELKAQNPNTPVVAYVNSLAEVKAESDVCCTSANAVKIVAAMDSKNIIFVPDKNMGKYVASKTGKKVITLEGYCPAHMNISSRDINRLKERYPKAEVLVHAECKPDVIALANQVLSTSGMCKYAKTSKCKDLIIGTEKGILNRLQKESPEKKFHMANERAVCQDMSKITLQKVLTSLEDLKPIVKLNERIIEKAGIAIDKMFELSSIK